jgi:hypothetical protein
MLLVYQTPKSPKLVTRRIFNPHAQWRIQGEWGIIPHRPQTPRPRKKFICENNKFFRRFAPIIVQLIKKKYINVTGKCQNCRNSEYNIIIFLVCLGMKSYQSYCLR